MWPMTGSMAARRLRSRRMVGVTPRFWPEMNTHPRNWKIPLWLNIDDFFAPVRTKAPLQPPRIFVRMKREVDESS